MTVLRLHSWILALGVAIAIAIAPAAEAEEITEDIEAAGGTAQRNLTANLPLFKSIAGERQDELPLPVGVNFAYMHTWDKLEITRLDASLGGATIPVPPSDLSDVKVSTDSFTGTIDIWILPFLDLYMVGGYSQGNADITVSIPNLLPRLDVEVPYEVWTWGGGGILTGGWDRYIGLVNLTYTVSSVDVIDSKVGSLLVSPRVGVRAGHDGIEGVLIVGANYMSISQNVFGSYDLGPLAVGYDLDIREADAWNGSIGVNIDFWKHLNLLVEGGIGTRRSVLASLIARF
ncbi:MAG: hypothetical protein P8R42_01290 [Candidatus Binatia bacterium]|nr:hypothetical protein [Candidatus Binatia bacterium]